MVHPHFILVGFNCNDQYLLYILLSFTTRIAWANGCGTGKFPIFRRSIASLKSRSIWEVNKHRAVLLGVFHAISVYLQRTILLLSPWLRLLWHFEKHHQTWNAYASSPLAVVRYLVLCSWKDFCFSIGPHSTRFIPDHVFGSGLILRLRWFTQSKPIFKQADSSKELCFCCNLSNSRRYLLFRLVEECFLHGLTLLRPAVTRNTVRIVDGSLLAFRMAWPHPRAHQLSNECTKTHNWKSTAVLNNIVNRVWHDSFCSILWDPVFEIHVDHPIVMDGKPQRLWKEILDWQCNWPLQARYIRFHVSRGSESGNFLFAMGCICRFNSLPTFKTR